MRSLKRLSLILLLALSAVPVSAQSGRCPVNGRPLPTAEERQFLTVPRLLRCFMTVEEITIVRSSIGHNAQTTVSDPAFESGTLNPDGSPRPPLTGEQIDALTKMHSILDDDMRTGAIVRKFIPNSDVGGFLYGRTVVGPSDAPFVVFTNTVRGFVGLERNTRRLDAGETVGALGLDFETGATGQFTDDSPLPFRRQVSREIQDNGLHSIRHRMIAQGAADAKIPLAKDLNDFVQESTPSLEDRSFEMNRQGQENPYTGLGISHHIGLLTLTTRDAADATYPLHLNQEDVMTVPTPLAVGDQLLRRDVRGREILVATYGRTRNPDGTEGARWQLSSGLSADDVRYYRRLIRLARERVASVGD